MLKTVMLKSMVLKGHTHRLRFGAAGLVLTALVAFAAPGFAQQSPRIALLTGKANNGDAAAAYNLGLAYHLGHDVTKDDTEAAKWLTMAAAKGDLQAKNILGSFYHEGWGVAKDDAKALQYYKDAADKKYAKAEYNLGEFYHDGTAVRKDITEAVRWFKMAAEQGETAAQVELGMIYLQGEGPISPDYAESYIWFAIAAHNGDDTALQYRDRVQKTLSAQQQADVRTRLQAWAQAHGDSAAPVKK